MLLALFGMNACESSVDPIELPSDYPVVCENGVCHVPGDHQSSLPKECEQDGTAQCYENVLLVCISGRWKNIIECPYGCSDAKCLPAECTSHDAERCDESGKNLQVCDNGKWTSQACEFGCRDGVCICSDDMEPRCKDDNTLEYCANETLKYETCAQGCKDNACATECQPGETKCLDEQSFSVCGENGLWGPGSVCIAGCADNECVPADCDFNDKPRCSEENPNQVQICDRGHWVDDPDGLCDFACEDGKCKIPQEACEEEDALRCVDEKRLDKCVDKLWTVEKNCEFGCENNACKVGDEDPCAGKGENEVICLADGAYQCSGEEPAYLEDGFNYGCNHCRTNESSAMCTKDGSGLADCDDGNWKITNCPLGCADGKCRDCEPGNEALLCSADGNVTQCGDDGFWTTVASCPHGCLDGVCLECADEPLACDGNVIVGCVNGKSVKQECAHKCENAKCVSKYDEACEKSCKDGVCSHGVCVTSKMDNIKLGDECDHDDFVEFCDDGEAVYCSVYGFVIRESCGENQCTMVQDYNNSSRLLAFCRGDADKCTKDREKLFYCTLDNALGFYESYNECLINTDDSFTAINAFDNHEIGRVDLDEVVGNNVFMCFEGGCDAEGKRCLKTSDEYYCAPEEQKLTYTCDGNDIIIEQCLDGALVFGLSGKDESEVEPCDDDNCVIIDGKGACRAACKGTKVGKNDPVCYVSENGESYVFTDTCAKDDNGTLYRVDSQTVKCDHSCSEGACQNLIDDEGKSCNEEEYPPQCSGEDILVTCEKGVIKAKKCSGENGVNLPQHCEMVEEGDAACVDDPGVAVE